MFTTPFPLWIASLLRIVTSGDKVINFDCESQNPFNPECNALVSSPPIQEMVGTGDDEECPIKSVPVDCLTLALEYLCSARDLDNFKRTSDHFEKVYDCYKSRQSEKFVGFKVLLDHSRCRHGRRQSYQDLLQCVPCIHDVYLDVGNDTSIDALSRMHFFWNYKAVRGLTSGLNQPFLSLSFVTDEYYLYPKKSLLLLCVFGFDGLANVMIIKYHHEDRYSTRVRQWISIGNFDLENFDLGNLTKIWKSKHLQLGSQDWYLASTINNASVHEEKCCHCCIVWRIMFRCVRLICCEREPFMALVLLCCAFGVLLTLILH